MEVFLYNSNVCRLCGEENDNGTLLYSGEENNQNLSEIINTYLPIKVTDDGQLPRTICPGCTIQLEATVEFLTLIINGQKVIRELYQREREYKKTLLNPISEEEIITEKIIYEVNTDNGVYQVEHPIALQVAGLEKPKRKRGRPPKKSKTPEELAKEAAAKEELAKSVKKVEKEDEPTGKRRRKTPTRFREAVQGKELERIFKEEGVTDGEESDAENIKLSIDQLPKPPVTKEPEVIGHMEDSGELVVVVKGKGRGRPKGPMRQTRKECAICGLEFTCKGRYMSHVAQHGPVLYQCELCQDTFSTRLDFTDHQTETGHTGRNIIPFKNGDKVGSPAQRRKKTPNKNEPGNLESVLIQDSESQVVQSPALQIISDPPVSNSLPDLNAEVVASESSEPEFLKTESPPVEVNSSPSIESDVKVDNTTPDAAVTNKPGAETMEVAPTGKVRLKCNHCDKTFSNKQSKSLHIKATHQGERPYVCAECGAGFAYPRSLALHAVSHRRHRHEHHKGFACDLCGKVLNHPSSVVYHKEAEHAGQRYVCIKCGKCFKHKQLLQRHQLVHSQDRPYHCKSCNASFKTKANLLNHSLLHSGVKKFSCEICKHRFAHKTSLTLHMRWHTGQKPYSCTTCGKSFSQKGNLSEHERIHTGEKPFQCTMCPRRFTTSSQHRLHARRHGPDRPHACALCGKRFVSRAAWSAHVRRESALVGVGVGVGVEHRCLTCHRVFPTRPALLKHARHHSQVTRQVSLLANSNPQPPASPPQEIQIQQLPQIHELQLQTEEEEEKVVLPNSPIIESTQEDDMEDESVIYVTYDVDDNDSPAAFTILDPDQVKTIAAGLEESNKVDNVLTTCELYSAPSVVVPQQLQHEELHQLTHELVLEHEHNMPVTDEQGNPLHFTMQDGTRLAITSADGKSLQVITQDGQTIPVEINGYADEEEVESPDTIVHQLNLQKSVDTNVSSPVTHYFTIV